MCHNQAHFVLYREPRHSFRVTDDDAIGRYCVNDAVKVIKGRKNNTVIMPLHDKAGFPCEYKETPEEIEERLPIGAWVTFDGFTAQIISHDFNSSPYPRTVIKYLATGEREVIPTDNIKRWQDS